MDAFKSELPPYTYIPGQTPHPFSDPEGHSFETPEETPKDLNEVLLRGKFLFENGYFWEAHEAWEQGWILLGRNGEQADSLKGLIKLAACGVKCLEGNRTGADRHFRRAVELLKKVLDARAAIGDISCDDCDAMLKKVHRLKDSLASSH